VKQQTHSLWPNQEQLLFYIDYLLTFIQFSDFYQEAIFGGKENIPQILANVFQNTKHSQEKKKAFQLTKCVFFFFSLLWTPSTFKPHNFLISYSL
jgi:hypothetical protein